MKPQTTALLAALALAAGLWWSAPSRAQETHAQETPAAPNVLRPLAAGDARVRVVHASVGTGAVDVYVGEDGSARKVLAGVTLGAVSDYLDVPAGTTRIRVTPAGGLLSSALINATPTLASGQYYTVAACQPAASIATPCVSEDSFGTPIAAGQARVRLFHYAPAPTQTPLDLTADAVGGASVGVIVNDQAVGALPGVAALPAGSYNLSLTTSNNGTVLETLRAVQVLPGRIYDLFAIGTGSGFRIVSSISDPRAKLRVVHAVVGGEAVDAYVGGAKVAADLTFFEASPYAPVTPGSGISAYVALAGQTAPYLTAASVTLEPGKAYTLVARGAIGSFGTLGYDLLLDDLAAPAAGSAKLRFVHLSPDAPEVNLRANGLPLTAGAVGFRSASGYVELPAATYTVQAVVASGGSAGATALGLPLLALEDGKIYDVFAVGSLVNLRAETRVTDARPALRVVHGAPLIGAVDVYVDGARALTDVRVGQLSAYLRLAPGLRRVQVVQPTGGDPSTGTVLDTQISAEAGQHYTVGVRATETTVTPAAVSVQALVFIDAPYLAGRDRATVRVYHLAAAAPTVDVRVAGSSTPLIDNLAFGASAAVELDAGSYTLEVTGPSGTPVVLPVPNLRAEGRQSYDLFALDTGAAAPTALVTSALARDVPSYVQFMQLVTR